MAKPHTDAPSARGGDGRLLIDGLQLEAIAETCNRLVRQIDEINRAWLGSLQQANRASWDLAGRLMRCSDPMEANRLCTDWLNERRDALLTDGQLLSDLWLRLYGTEPAATPLRPSLGESAPARMAAAE
jgi:hypothetical protein